MKGRYPFRPFVVPALVGALTATGLVAALLSDGLLEAVAIGLLLLVVGPDCRASRVEGATIVAARQAGFPDPSLAPVSRGPLSALGVEMAPSTSQSP